MQEFKIAIEEVRRKVVTVNATDLTEALATATEEYKSGKIELTPENMKYVHLSRYLDIQTYDDCGGERCDENNRIFRAKQKRRNVRCFLQGTTAFVFIR